VFAQIPFAGNAIDRLDRQRHDPQWLTARLADPASRFLPFHDLKALIVLGDAPAPGWVTRDAVAAALDGGGEVALLGELDGRCRFAVDLAGRVDPVPLATAAGGKFIDVRSIAPDLPADASGLLAQARSLLDWHARHRYCARCGGPTESRDGGNRRACTTAACGASHFPRNEPVVIMLIARGDHCLFGRQHRFAPDFWSCLAGFVETGETLEAAVRREAYEEAGVTVGAVRYLGSQPWPFPSSLMLGCHAEALDETLDIDRRELADARWFERTEVASMLANCHADNGPRVPAPVAIAHHLVRCWLEG